MAKAVQTKDSLQVICDCGNMHEITENEDGEIIIKTTKPKSKKDEKNGTEAEIKTEHRKSKSFLESLYSDGSDE